MPEEHIHKHITSYYILQAFPQIQIDGKDLITEFNFKSVMELK